MPDDAARRLNVEERIQRIASTGVQINPFGIFLDVIVNELFPGEEGRAEFDALVITQWEAVLDEMEQKLRESGHPIANGGLVVPPGAGGLIVP